MNNNTKIRLHLSKNLFESVAREVLAEAKRANDGYTVAVKQPKMPKQSKSQAASPEVQKTDAEAMMGEMETKVAEKAESTKAPKAKKAAGHDVETLKKAKAAIEKLLGEMETEVAEGKEEEKDTLKEYEHHYERVNGQCRRYNDEGDYEVVSDHYCD